MANNNPFSLTTIERRLKHCAEQHGVELPRPPTGGCTLAEHIGRCANLLREHSPELKNVNLARVGDETATLRLASLVCDAAERARPRGAPDGGLRQIVKNVGGRDIVTWAADHDDALWKQFTHNTLKIGKFLRPAATKTTLI